MNYRDALTHYSDACNMCTSNKFCSECEMNYAMKALEDKLYIPVVLAEAELLHPYKVPGHPDTYSDYNQGWMDALAYVDSRLNKEELDE